MYRYTCISLCVWQIKLRNFLNQNCKKCSRYCISDKVQSIKVIDVMVPFFYRRYIVCIGETEQKNDTMSRYFRKVHFCGQFVSLGTRSKVMKWFSNESRGRSGILAKKATFLYPPYKFYYGAPRGYIIPSNFSARTIRVEAAAEFIRRDIFWLRETLSRNPWLATVYIRRGLRMAIYYIIK